MQGYSILGENSSFMLQVKAIASICKNPTQGSPEPIEDHSFPAVVAENYLEKAHDGVEGRTSTPIPLALFRVIPCTTVDWHQFAAKVRKSGTNPQQIAP
jgi:hypothetical protein